MTVSKITAISAWLGVGLVGQTLAMGAYRRAIEARGGALAAHGASVIGLVWPSSIALTLMALAGLWVLARTITPSLREPLVVRA